MAVRKVIRMGHPTLRRVSRLLEPEEIGSDWFRALVHDMVDTLHDYGGIGLAAPQIGEPVRIAVVEVPPAEGPQGEVQSMPLTVFVNPEVEIVDPASRGYWEGCLSVPGLRGFVERPQHVRVEYLDLQGRKAELELQGFFATVLQHEFDHLDGRLYIDRVKDPRLLSFEEEFMRYLAPREEGVPEA